MKNENRRQLLSIVEIARRCKLHRTTVAIRLDLLGYEPDPSSTPNLHLFPFDDAMEFAIKSTKDPLSAARIRGMRASAQLKELDLAVQRGEMISYDDAVEISYKLHKAIYADAVNDKPKRLARKILKCKTAAEVKKLLKADTDKFFARLRKDFPDLGENK